MKRLCARGEENKTRGEQIMNENAQRDNGAFVYNTGVSTVTASVTIFGMLDNSTRCQIIYSDLEFPVNQGYCRCLRM